MVPRSLRRWLLASSLAAGACAGSANEENLSPELLALEMRYGAIADLELESGTTVERVRSDGDTALSYSIAGGHVQFIEAGDGFTLDDVVAEIVDLGRSEGWEMGQSFGGWWCGNQSTPTPATFSVMTVETSTTDGLGPHVEVALGVPCRISGS